MLQPMSSKPEAPADASATDQEGAPKKGGKKKLILMAAPVLLIGVLAGLWFSGILPGLLGMKHEDQHAAEAEKPGNPVYIDLPDMIANLGGTSTRPIYVKLLARLEVAKPEDADKVKANMPRLQDAFQSYLREMRPEELRGSAGTYRLREELLGRANVAVAPAKVMDVLFVQLLIQ
jgi:flagellar protein FliL